MPYLLEGCITQFLENWLLTFPSLSEALADFQPLIHLLCWWWSKWQEKQKYLFCLVYLTVELLILIVGPEVPELPASARALSVSQVKQPEEFLYSEGFLCLPATHWSALRLLCSSNHWYSAILLFLLLSLQVSLLGQDICAATAAVVSVNWRVVTKGGLGLGNSSLTGMKASLPTRFSLAWSLVFSAD